jgi:hypothetical protein
MGQIRTVFAATCAVVLLTAAGAAAQATTADRLTNVTFSGPVAIPGSTLPAGTYQFKLADSPSDRHIVQVFDKDQKLIATLLAVPAERPEERGDPVVTFKETRSDQPPAVRYWFYAGERSGNELVYPKSQALTIAKASGEPVMAMETESSDIEALRKVGVSKVTGNTEPTSTASTTTTKPDTTTTAPTATTTTQPPTTTTTTTPATTAPTTPTTTAPTTPTTTAPTTPTTTATTPTTTAPTTPTTTAPEPRPTTEPTTAPPPPPVTTTPPATAPTVEPNPPATVVGTSGRTASLPKTASQLPAIGLIGLLALAGAFSVRALRRSVM